jgi:hypothetical protein
MKRLIIISFLIFYLFPHHSFSWIPDDSLVVDRLCKKCKLFMNEFFNNPKDYLKIFKESKNVDCSWFLNKMKNDKNVKKGLEIFIDGLDTQSVIDLGCMSINQGEGLLYLYETNNNKPQISFDVISCGEKDEKIYLLDFWTMPEKQVPKKAKYDTAYIKECFTFTENFIADYLNNPTDYYEISKNSKDISCESFLEEFKKNPDSRKYYDRKFKKIKAQNYSYKFDVLWDQNIGGKVAGFSASPGNEEKDWINLPIFRFKFQYGIISKNKIELINVIFQPEPDCK